MKRRFTLLHYMILDYKMHGYHKLIDVKRVTLENIAYRLDFATVLLTVLKWNCGMSIIVINKTDRLDYRAKSHIDLSYI